MNCVVLVEKIVCVEASEAAQIKQLEKLAFDLISVPLHCWTADVYREGTCKDYFAKQVVLGIGYVPGDYFHETLTRGLLNCPVAP